MSQETKNSYSLSRRIITQFCLFSLFMSVIFSALNFLFLFVIEDTFITREIDKEAQYLWQQYQQTQQWETPRKAYISLHHSVNTLPEIVQTLYSEEPLRQEFYGDNGLHYHLFASHSTPKFYLLAEVSQQLIVRPMRTPILILLSAFALIMTFIATFIAYRLAKKTINPLTKLVNLVENVSPDKLPKHFSHDYPNNEIGRLAKSLEQSMQKIQKFVEREQHFTLDASHELRTPISIIKNATELLANNQFSAEETQLLERISRACLQMEQNTNALLSLAREDDSLLTTTNLALLPYLEKAIVEQAYLLKNKPVEVNLLVQPDVQITFKPAVLQILIANLIANAFQYTSQGAVTIDFQQNHLIICDTGPGIEKDIKDKVLEPLVKGSQSQGFGIGLSIVKRLCEHHHLVLKIGNKNQGTEVSIFFNQT